MTSDDRLVELIQLSMQRTRQLSEAGRQHSQALADLNTILDTTTTRMENSVQQAETALGALHNRVHQLETDLASALDEASSSLQQARTRQSESHTLHQAAQTEVDAALARLFTARVAAVSQLHHDLALARQNLGSATTDARTTAAAVSQRADQLREQVGQTHQALEASRQALEQQARTSLAEYATMRNALMAQVKRLEQETSVACRRTQEAVDSMAEGNRRAKDKVDHLVVNYLAVEQGRRCAELSAELGRSLEAFKQVTVRPRRTADEEVLGLTRRIRETFPALEKIAAVFKAAQEQEMV